MPVGAESLRDVAIRLRGNHRHTDYYAESFMLGRSADISMNAPRLYRIALPVLMVLPILAYRDAYRGYFDADDFGSLNWARVVPLKDHIVSLPDLKYPNGRPVGYLYYGVMARIAGFNFAPWVFVLELLGALNI